MILLATQVEPMPVEHLFPEGLENDNKQSGACDDNISEQEQEDAED